MVATVHLHVLHHSLDPFGIVLAGLAIAVVIVLAGLVGARLVRKKADTAPPEPGTGTGTGTGTEFSTPDAGGRNRSRRVSVERSP